jgi:hypothetical protein
VRATRRSESAAKFWLRGRNESWRRANVCAEMRARAGPGSQHKETGSTSSTRSILPVQRHEIFLAVRPECSTGDGGRAVDGLIYNHPGNLRRQGRGPWADLRASILQAPIQLNTLRALSVGRRWVRLVAHGLEVLLVAVQLVQTSSRQPAGFRICRSPACTCTCTDLRPPNHAPSTGNPPSRWEVVVPAISRPHSRGGGRARGRSTPLRPPAHSTAGTRSAQI